MSLRLWRGDFINGGLATVLHRDEPKLVDQAVGGKGIAVQRHIHVPPDVAPARDRPALECFVCRIETDYGYRLGAGFFVPKRTFCKDNAVRFRLWPAWRFPFLHIASR